MNSGDMVPSENACQRPAGNSRRHKKKKWVDKHTTRTNQKEEKEIHSITLYIASN